MLPSKDESLLDAYHKWRTRAANKVCCDYALHVGVPSWSDEVNFTIKLLHYNNYKFKKYIYIKVKILL